MTQLFMTPTSAAGDKPAKGQNGWHPESDKQPLLPVYEKPQVNGEQKGQTGGDQK
jgi:hypothetical protein